MEQKKLENCLLFLFISKSCVVLSVPYTAKNTAISAGFLVWKFCGKAQFPHSFGRFTFPQNFHARKSGEITVFLAVVCAYKACDISEVL